LDKAEGRRPVVVPPARSTVTIDPLESTMIFEPDPNDRRLRKETEPIRAGLAERVAAFVGNDEERATSLPGLSFAKVTVPTPPTSYLYDPCISMIIRGGKRVRLGGTSGMMPGCAFTTYAKPIHRQGSFWNMRGGMPV
jgi:hypothetical protein